MTSLVIVALFVILRSVSGERSILPKYVKVSDQRPHRLQSLPITIIRGKPDVRIEKVLPFFPGDGKGLYPGEIHVIE